jgi:hypothetical protein
MAAVVTWLCPEPVGRIWKKHGLKPHLGRTFRVSDDPLSAEQPRTSSGRA